MTDKTTFRAARARSRKAEILIKRAVTAMFVLLAAVCVAVAVRALTAPADPAAAQAAAYVPSGDVDVRTEEFWGGGARHVRVLNCGKRAVYVRITPYFKVTDAQGRLRDAAVSDDAVLAVNTADWIRRGGSYYYPYPLEPNKYTPFFIEDCRFALPDGITVETSFTLRAVAADDLAALAAKWSARPADDGLLEFD